nr:MAG TPA: hypothetical protein [Bacteriophage sp.]
MRTDTSVIFTKKISRSKRSSKMLVFAHRNCGI